MNLNKIIKAGLIITVLFLFVFVSIPVSAKIEKDPVLEKYSKMGILMSGKLSNISDKMLHFGERGFELSGNIIYFSKYGDQISASHFKEGLNVYIVLNANRKVIMVKKR